MQKFERTELATTGKSDYEQIKGIQNKFAHFGKKITMSIAKKIFKEEFDCEVYVNDIYQVNILRGKDCDQYIHIEEFKGKCDYITIKTHDKKEIRDWRHFQTIKNELCGENREAVEIFPSEKRLVDTANQYHLWVLPEGQMFPFGFDTRKVDYTERHGGLHKVGQRPLEESTI